MLYRTPHPFFFQFRTFTSSPISSSATGALPVPAPFSTNPCVQAETEMECVEAALKTSLKSDSGVKSFAPAVLDEMLAGNGQNGAACDDFFVDELLDLSNEDGFVKEEPVEEEEEEEEEEEDKGLGSVSVRRDPGDSNADTNAAANNKINNIICSVKDEFGPGLSVPADDVADLEWLSHFVEDSFTEFSVPYPAGMLTEKPKAEEAPEPEPEPEQEPEKPCFKSPVPAKARSKRTRTGGRVWSLGSPSLTESSSCSSTSTTSSSSPSSPWLIYSVTAQNSDPLEPVRPPAKKQKKKQPGEAGAAQPPRRCSHCGVQKTPQWRTGPLGAKTLCNACGVRFKSGRLLPEYRPACSPTFSSELHSNHHRKVLEMRRKKETLGETESGLAPPVVSSF